MHICIGKITIISSDNGLSSEWGQGIIWTSSGILLTVPLRTNFSEMLNKIQTFFSLKKIHLKMSSAKCCLFRLGRLHLNVLTHWGRVTHICVGKLTNIGSDNGLSPGRRQAIIWTNDEILLIGPLGTNFSEFLIVIHTFSFNKCTWKCRLRNGVHFVSASMC